MNSIPFLDKNFVSKIVKHVQNKKMNDIFNVLDYVNVSPLIPSNIDYYIDINKYISKIKKIDLNNTSSLSIVYITKNEEQHIRSSLQSSVNLADEIIVLDTGSTDNTIEQINSLKNNKIKVYTTTWSDDFSEARNKANNYATSDWILTLDADEKIDFDIMSFKTLLNYLNNFPDLSNYVFNLNLKNDNNMFSCGRLIKNTSTFSYKGKVHEIYSHKTKYQNYSYINLNFDISFLERNSIKKAAYYNTLLLETINLYPYDQRWMFLYIRDNFSNIDSSTLEELSDKYLFFKSNTLEITNIKMEKYTHNLLILYLKKYLEEGLLSKFNILLAFTKKLFDSIDLIYLEFLYKETTMIEKYHKILQEFIVHYKNLPEFHAFYSSDYMDGLFANFLLKTDYFYEAKTIYRDLYIKNPDLPCFQQNITKSMIGKVEDAS